MAYDVHQPIRSDFVRVTATHCVSIAAEIGPGLYVNLPPSEARRLAADLNRVADEVETASLHSKGLTKKTNELQGDPSVIKENA